MPGLVFVAKIFSYLLLLQIVMTKTHVNAVVVLRGHHISGPAAISAGTSCLQELTKSYFDTTNKVHIPNLAIFFMHGLSSPAAEISDEYLKWMHTQLMDADAERFLWQMILI